MSDQDRNPTNEQDTADEVRVDDLSQAVSNELADQVRGGLSVPSNPATPPGVPIPYPSTTVSATETSGR
jgi:hypothetical protein